MSALLPSCAKLLGADFDDYDLARSPGSELSAKRVLHRAPDKLDLLFVIDNSLDMFERQMDLAASAPDFLAGLVNPPCVDVETGAPGATPADPSTACPPGHERRFAPVRDLHVGMITTSLGGHGADTCSAGSGSFDPTMNDGGRLVARAPGGGVIDTYDGRGFLAWDPDARADPPGSDDLSDLSRKLGDMIVGAGTRGCGFESTLEAWYRFLVEPEPPAELARVPCFDGDGSLGCIAKEGTDEALLTQRRAFLRPDSMVMIVMVTAENDCSVIEGGQHHLVLQSASGAAQFHLPRATDVCEVDPTSRCCHSCAQPAPAGCPPVAESASCQANGGFYDAAGGDDALNLRCFDQKRRFGIDFLNPVEKYIQGLRSLQVLDGSGNVVPNPLYTDLAGTGAAVRDPSFVVLAGAVGVPWQDVVTDATLADPSSVFEYLSGAELAAENRWEVILGDPTRGLAPKDPLMIESIDPRSGENPITGEPLAPPTAGFLANSMNGHERAAGLRDELQFACITPLVSPNDCSTGGGCPCAGPPDDANPLCQEPSGTYGQRQYFTAATPGLRLLQVLKGAGDSSVVTSICTPNVADPARADFAYRPMVPALGELVAGKLGGVCLDAPIQAGPDGAVPCSVIEALPSRGAPCNCTTAGRFVPVASVRAAAAKLLAADGNPGFDCLCEVEQLFGADRAACQTSRAAPERAGWCYVSAGASDAASGGSFPAVGAPGLVAHCREGEKNLVRFGGSGRPADEAVAVVVCDDSALKAERGKAPCSPGNCFTCASPCDSCLCLTAGDRPSCTSGGSCTP